MMCVVLLTAVFGFRFGRGLYETWEYSWQWKRALEFQPPPEAVLYEEEPTKARALLASPDYHPPAKILLGVGWYPTPPAWWCAPACYTPRSLNRILVSEQDAVVWVHGRTAASGTQFLVIVRCSSIDFGPAGDTIGLYGRTYLQGTPKSGIMLRRSRTSEDTLVLQLKSGRDHFRVLAGQPDSADLSHFTIPFEVNDSRGIIDGWVRDTVGTGTKWVELKMRNGSAKRLVRIVY